MKKILLFSFVLFLIGAVLYLIYLNETVLPEKIRAAVVDELSRATGKQVSLAYAKIDILKGLVLKDLKISDGNISILTSKKTVCSFLVIPLLKKQIIITSLKLESPEIFIERPSFFNKLSFPVTISRIIISKGAIDFKDSTVDPAVNKRFNDVDLDIRIALPDKVIFKSECSLFSDLPAYVKCSGEYSVRKNELSLEVNSRDLYLRELAPYLKDANIELPDGRVDAVCKFSFRDRILDGLIDMTALNLVFSQNKITADLNCAAKLRFKYNFADKELIYKGDLVMKNLALSGLDYVGKINDIRGKVIFSDASFSSDDITCTILGVPVRVKEDLADLHDPVMKLSLSSRIDLHTLGGILKHNFNMDVPAEMSGEGDLNVALLYKIPISQDPVVSGSLDLSGAKLNLRYCKKQVEDIKGKINFTYNQLKWEQLFFKYAGIDYKSFGTLTNFEKPGLDLKLSSDRLSLSALLAVSSNIITLSQLEGQYDDIEFSARGQINAADPSNIIADMTGSLVFNIEQNEFLTKKINDIFKGSKPSGMVEAAFNLKGDMDDPAHLAIDADISSKLLSIYGFKINDFNMECLHKNGYVNIAKMHSSLYGGTIDASGSVDIASKDAPFQVNADIKGVKIEKIKEHTVFKNIDISGLIQAHIGAKGSSNDLPGLNAWGKLNIFNGKLWQIDLFRGIGAILFKKDFNSVIFKEGSCDFVIKDKVAFINDLSLKSDLLNLYGTAKIGFDNSISAYLKSEFTDEGIDAGNVSDFAGAIEKYSIIEVKGSLKEPKCKFRPDLSNIGNDLLDNLLRL